jgi:hypothetical protein
MREANQKEDIAGDYFRSAAPHEFTHAVLARAIGTMRLPPWLNKGIAQVAGGRACPGMVKENDKRMQSILTVNRVLGLELLSSDARFYDSRETPIGEASGAPSLAFIAYNQGYHMTRYLLSKQSIQHGVL